MVSDDRVASSADPSRDSGGRHAHGGLHRWMKALFDLTPWGLKRRAEGLSNHQAVTDARLDRIEVRLDAIEQAQRATQSEISDLRERRLVTAEIRLDDLEGSMTAVEGETARLRDEVVPAMVGRSDVLIERIAAEIEEVGSLTERLLRGEPLPIPGDRAADEAKLAPALAEVQPALLEAFRGSEADIRHRLDRYLEALGEHAPVLDLGCGRGELLLLLREAGIDAVGVEGDAAVAQAARRRGLEIIEGDVVDTLRRQPDGSRGAVTAIHLFEHLEPATLLAALAEIRRVLRPGGLLIVECPNPHSLRVGASLFWIDPTHRRPLMPETVELYLKTTGFEVDRREMLHPFPSDELFTDAVAELPAATDAAAVALTEALDRLRRRLDEVVNGARDFVVWARKPNDPPA